MSHPIWTKIMASGKRTELLRMKEYVKSDELAFDYEKILPVPKGEEEVAWKWLNWWVQESPHDVDVWIEKRTLYIDITSNHSPVSDDIIIALRKEFPTLKIKIKVQGHW